LDGSGLNQLTGDQIMTTTSYRLGYSDGCQTNPVYVPDGVEDAAEYKRGFDDGVAAQDQYLDEQE
jgi:hypothetical protein